MSCNRWGAWRAAGAALLLVLSTSLFGLSPSVGYAKGPAYQAPLDTVAVAQLPPQGRDMMTLIYQGGPFRHDKDGVVFGNRERILPAKNRGYYREYTVRTPNERSRGARRIVCGGLKPAAPDACYYTDDHYASFRRIVQ
ncbi:ribonuclease domain-containing protein [Polaromonas jejuensis]|uniref:Ribonuclease domain-containing protein n=1 Tax=Polaromonas jejuensis TaxID=457502 RepID=A0ABW0QFC9_9BURK|nr:ribonuclease domain-containing protein [Polaromonas jejuensis]